MSLVDTLMPLVSALAILAVIPALAVLYREFVDATRPVASGLETLLICAVAAGIWLGLSALFPAVAGSRLQLPTTSLAALAAFLCSLPVRDATRRVLPALIFSSVWVIVVFTPIAIVDFFPTAVGLSPTAGPLDVGGALPVHVAVGSAALVVLLYGRNLGSVSRAHHRPRSWTLVLVTLILWAGWAIGLVGLELAADDAAARILINAIVGPLVGAAGWLVVERIRQRATTVHGAAAGLLCGLVAITAGSAYLTPLWAGIISAFAAIGAAQFTITQTEVTRRNAWIFVGAHLIAGGLGLILLGMFASDFGFIFVGQLTTLVVEIVSVLVVAAWAGGVSLALWPLIDRLTRRARLAEP
jgi:Amt family ammonium transporter